MDNYTIELPGHAVRLLRKMCDRERARLSQHNPYPYSLQLDAHYDSLNEIECALPADDEASK